MPKKEAYSCCPLGATTTRQVFVEFPLSILPAVSPIPGTHTSDFPGLSEVKESHPLTERLRKIVRDPGSPPLNQRAAKFLLCNTLGPRWNPNKHEETAALTALVEQIKEGGFTSWADFSRRGLVPYVSSFYPTPAPQQHNMEWYLKRRRQEEEGGLAPRSNSRAQRAGARA